MTSRLRELRVALLTIVFASLTIGFGVATNSVSARFEGEKRKILFDHTFVNKTCDDGACTHPDVGSCTIVIWSDGEVECNG